jgi:tRNA A-37 threonylcarbamoyl transferase component Bud32
MSALERAPVLPKYELLERIGVGGMATVYRARDRRLGREVAVKLIHTHLRENPEVAARFVSEARTVARLRHPNIVEVFDISDEDEPERYLVVQLVRGTTLRALVTRHKSLPPELAAAIGLEIASALSHAHEEGIVHRDVKPENVLVDLSSTASGTSGDKNEGGPPSRIKLTDFGIAKLLDAQGVTSTGQVLGSPAHMAPEQIEGGDVGPRADVFALGVLLYECMVGRLPFDGKNPAQVLRRVLDGTYPPADREEPRVGARWAAILARALARDAVDRYESVDAFAQAMRAELERTGNAEPRAEVERFLSDQDGYAVAAVPRLVEGIVSAGEKARAARDFSLAAAEFNRALAYRPGDPELVRRVSVIARRDRLFAVSRAAGSVLLASIIIVALGLFVRHRTLLKREAEKRAADQARGAKAAAPQAKGVVAAAASVASGAADTAPARRRPPVMRDPPHRRPSLDIEAVMRPVIVDVSGPKGGFLKIDGTREDRWFGVEHQLQVGPHTFEFVPENDECCRPSPPVTRVVADGEGIEHVPLTVAFRDARLRVDRSPPGVLRCRRLFGDDLAVPGALGVPMSALTANGPCTFVPADPASSGPVTKDVTLSAGQTTEISWP